MKIIPGENETLFTEELLLTALVTDSVSNMIEFTREEAFIRDKISDFMDWFEQFNEFVDAQVLTIDDLKPYIGYWINLIGDAQNPQLDDAVRQQLWQFIHRYRYTGVTSLCKHFGHDITNVDWTKVSEISKKVIERKAGKEVVDPSIVRLFVAPTLSAK